MRPDASALQRVLGVLGGRPVAGSLLADWADSAGLVIAADGGADSLLTAGVRPDIVVGDLDSLSEQARQLEDVRCDRSQETTDCDKLLALVAKLGADSITLVNVDGELPDHSLAILQSAARTKLNCRLLYDRGFGHILCGPMKSTFTGSGRVSLLPISPCTGVALSGVRWPFHGAELDPIGFTSISNAADGGPVQVEIETGAAFLFIEATPVPSWQP